MKKLIPFLLIATSVFAQSYQQNTGNVWNSWKHDPWVTQKVGETTETYFTDILAGDTVYSKVYFNAPGMCFFVTAIDTGSTDSVNVKVNLLGSHYSDTNKFVFIKTLSFTHSESKLAQASIDAAGYWWSDLSDEPYPALRYYEIQVIGLTGNAKLKGVKLRFDTRFNTGYYGGL